MVRACRRAVWMLAGAAVAVRAPAPAAADVTIGLRPGYDWIDTTSADELGVERRQQTSSYTGRYSLNLTNRIYPGLSFSGGGVLDHLVELYRSDMPARGGFRGRGQGHAELTLGNPLLGGGASYNRMQQFSPEAGDHAPILEFYTVGAQLRPIGLPRLSLTLRRTLNHDAAREVQDTVADEARLSVQYDTIESLRVGYTFAHGTLDNRIARTEATTNTHGVHTAYSDRFWNNRVAAAATYDLFVGSSGMTRLAGGSALATQRFPVAGLSLIEQFPAEPRQDTLNPNRALIDGDSTAGAAINLGFSPSLTGDRAFRDLGLGFADGSVQVRALYVWVDRRLPPMVASAFAWTVYRSDDNQTWVEVPLAGPVVFAVFENRFEISVQSVSARYLKVVTTPLPSTIVVDPTYADIFVTELQAFDTTIPGSRSTSALQATSTASVAVKTRLLERTNLAHDLSATVTRMHEPVGRTVFVITNGLGWMGRAGRVDLSARLARDDARDTSGYRSTNMYTASAAIAPLPTARANLALAGGYRSTPAGNTLYNTAALSGSADVYTGIAGSASLAYGFGRSEAGVWHQNAMATVTATVNPHPKLSLAADAGVSLSTAVGTVVPGLYGSSTQVNASATFRPLSTLTLLGSVSRAQVPGAPARTYSTFSGIFSPFPGGGLQLSFAYYESLDTAAELFTRRLGPSLHWIMRSRTYLDAGYAYLITEQQIGWTRTHSFSAIMTVML